MARYKVNLPIAATVEVFVEAANAEDAISDAFNEFENFCDLLAVDYRCSDPDVFDAFGNISSVEAIEGDNAPECEEVIDVKEATQIF